MPKTMEKDSAQYQSPELKKNYFTQTTQGVLLDPPTVHHGTLWFECHGKVSILAKYDAKFLSSLACFPLTWFYK